MLNKDSVENCCLEAEKLYFDGEANMLRIPVYAGTVHVSKNEGKPCIVLRESLNYGQALLLRSEPMVERAEAIIRRILPLQDTNPLHNTFGLWPYYEEIPIDQMTPPDWNWADFIGAGLLSILDRSEDILSEELVREMDVGIRNAAFSIFRRNVTADYTNIAIMGGGVTLAAGERLGESVLVTFGRNRLKAVEASVRRNGGFPEYNSPTYSMVALDEFERILQLVKDPEAREIAERLRVEVWEMIAAHFHPGTGQWAGPQSRAYHDWLHRDALIRLNWRLGKPLSTELRADEDKIRPMFPDLVEAIPCPEHLKERFFQLPQEPHSYKGTLRQEESGFSMEENNWFSEEACLGSANRSPFWIQTRGLLGYWKTLEDPAVCFRTRFLHDGRDFMSIQGLVAQENARALCAFNPLSNVGDFHVFFDTPEDGVFEATDLTLQFRLQGKGVICEQVSESCFILRAGGWRAAIHITESFFDGLAVQWNLVQETDVAIVEGVCYRGEKRSFDFKNLSSRIVTGVEILSKEESVSEANITLEENGNENIKAVWETEKSLSLDVPLKPQTWQYC